MAQGQPILAIHIQELRDRVVAGWAASSQIPRDGHASLSYYTASNRITTSGFAYDAAGNQVRALAQSGGSQRFKYDAANRLVQVLADNNTTVLASYIYGDSNERLIADESGLRTYYACNGSAEYIESGGSTAPAWSKSYVYLGGRLLATLTPNGSGGEAVQYHHPDRLGTRLVTDRSNATSFEQVTLPFGTALNAESTGATNRRFTSYDRSSTTGLDYAVNRHYDAQQGRFTQVDPIGMRSVSITSPQTLNLYAYCIDDPVNRIDPSGLGFLSFFKKLFKVITKILTIVAIVAAVALVMSFFPGGIGAFGHALFGLIMKGLSFLGPLKYAAGSGVSGEGGGWTLNPWGLVFSSVYTAGAIANYLQGQDRPKKITGATAEQLALITEAIDDLVNRIKTNKKCADLFGGQAKALKKLRESTISVEPLGNPQVITDSSGRIIYSTSIYNGATVGSTIKLASNVLLAPGGKISVLDVGTGKRVEVQGTPADVNDVSETLAHELSHRTKAKGIDPNDDDPVIGKRNDDKVREACGYPKNP